MKGLVDAKERRRLRARLALFLIAVAVPSALLLGKALDQLKWEAMRQSQLAAEEVARRIDARLGELIREQDTRSFADFAFLTVAGDPQAGFLQRSPLSAFPVDAKVPGLIGWFQIDAAGQLSTPLLPQAGVDPSRYGLGAEELTARRSLQQRIAAVLDQNAVVTRPKIAEPLASDSRERTSLWRSDGSRGASRPLAGRPGRMEGQAIFDAISSKDRAEAEQSRQVAKAQARETDRAAGVPQSAPAASIPPAAGARETSAAPMRRARTEQVALPESAALEESGLPAGSAVSEEARAFGGWSALEAADHGPVTERPSELEPATEPATEEALAASAPSALRGPRILIFESELDPFRFSRLQSGHFVLFRWAWRDGARYVQGALIDRDRFLAGVIGQAFLETPLSGSASLVVAFGDEPVAEYGARSGRYAVLGSAQLPEGTVLYASRLQEPFGALRLAFLAEHLPTPPGAGLIYWLGVILVVVLAGGLWLLYRLGLRQLALIRQQQDFVAAVSHEMKTPLTSIRMYSEMLREGWVSAAKRPTYYRFIHDESERLSRLIANVLQLARMGREEPLVTPRPIRIAELLEACGASLASQAERAGFELVVDCAAPRMVRADADAVTQILINLVDNAIKFSAEAERKRIEVECGEVQRGRLPLRVRDYGPGIPKAERTQAFELFRRLENEATRKTQGTGIGLALVERLARAMKAEVELVGCLPGVEARLWLPIVADGQDV